MSLSALLTSSATTKSLLLTRETKRSNSMVGKSEHSATASKFALMKSEQS